MTLVDDHPASAASSAEPERLCRFPEAPDQVAALAARFQAAQPFPSIVLDNVLTIDPEEVTAAFPDPNWPAWGRFTDHYQANKRYCGDIEQIPPLLARIIAELSQPRFLRFLEQVTGIPALLLDPYLEGGGLHASGPGGILAPHTDFHLLDRLNLYRRVNIILYLNPVWQADWGGCLGLYRTGDAEPTQQVVPEFGRMVIFRTDHKSVHGFAVPVADGRWRRSIALYYYTAQEAAEFSGDHTTYWRQHGELGPVGKAQLAVHKGLMGVSTLFAQLAHKANPHTSRLGAARLAKTRRGEPGAD